MNEIIYFEVFAIFLLVLCDFKHFADLRLERIAVANLIIKI